jgi:hypothetical protein
MGRKKKVCSRCMQELVLDTNFNKDSRNKGGYRYECKLCQYKAQHKSLDKKIKEMEDKRDVRTRTES